MQVRPPRARAPRAVARAEGVRRDAVRVCIRQIPASGKPAPRRGSKERRSVRASPQGDPHHAPRHGGLVSDGGCCTACQLASYDALARTAQPLRRLVRHGHGSPCIGTPRARRG